MNCFVVGRSCQYFRRAGFSLIELLVVLGIIALLIGILIPAVQRSREAAYRLQSQNNLRQIGTAFHHYSSAVGHLPHNGGYSSPNIPLVGSIFGLGDPQRPAHHQPGSWCYSLLPYLEQETVYRNIRNASFSPPAVSVPLKVYNLPSRRPSLADYQRNLAEEMIHLAGPSDVVTERIWGLGSVWARTDYALNAGLFCPEQTDLASYRGIQTCSHGINPLPLSEPGGVKLRFEEFRDGTSETILVGEKAVANYELGTVPPSQPSAALDQPALSGGTGATAVCDLTISPDGKRGSGWGSPFAAGTHFLFGDGSVRLLPFGESRDFQKRLHTLMSPSGGVPAAAFDR